MNTTDITQDDLYDLGFEPTEGSSKTMDYEHKELGIKIWKGMADVNAESKFWKSGYGKDKVIFHSLEELKDFMETSGDGE
jgi:hypothetical protein